MTHYNVLNVPKATTYYWIYTSGKSEDYPVVLLSCKHEVPSEFPYIIYWLSHSDAYATYGKCLELRIFTAGHMSVGNFMERSDHN